MKLKFLFKIHQNNFKTLKANRPKQALYFLIFFAFGFFNNSAEATRIKPPKVQSSNRFLKYAPIAAFAGIGVATAAYLLYKHLQGKKDKGRKPLELPSEIKQGPQTNLAQKTNDIELETPIIDTPPTNLPEKRQNSRTSSPNTPSKTQPASPITPISANSLDQTFQTLVLDTPTSQPEEFTATGSGAIPGISGKKNTKPKPPAKQFHNNPTDVMNKIVEEIKKITNQIEQHNEIEFKDIETIKYKFSLETISNKHSDLTITDTHLNEYNEAYEKIKQRIDIFQLFNNKFKQIYENPRLPKDNIDVAKGYFLNLRSSILQNLDHETINYHYYMSENFDFDSYFLAYIDSILFPKKN